ncbi:MAG: hypothetical protein AABZ53_02540 [Planctomycetota bacterium]
MKNDHTKDASGEPEPQRPGFDAGMSRIDVPRLGSDGAPTGLPGALDQVVVDRLFQMGISTPQRPIDHLVQRLSGPGSSAWLGDALRMPQVGCKGDPESGLARGRLNIREIDDMKERCKTAALTDGDTHVRLATTAGYYIAIAAAAVHHHRLISSQPRGELSSMLLDLGSVAPEPWATLLGRAALELGAA